MTVEESQGQSHAPPPRSARSFTPLGLIRLCEDGFHYAIAFLLLIIGVIVIYHTAAGLLQPNTTFANDTINAINGVLLAVILLELLTTVVSHFDHGGLELKPFLIIAMVSALRHILTIGARLTLSGEVTGVAFRDFQIELGVETGVVLGLAIALLLVRSGEKTDADRLEDD